MIEKKIYYRISPEVLKGDVLTKSFSGETNVNLFGSYTGMTYILSGGTGGTSLLTGLTIPILLTQTYNDVGVYNVFDGLITQKDVITNFILSAYNQNNLYQVRLYNTSENEKKSFLKISNHFVDWGDGTPVESVSKTKNHTYSYNGEFVISFSGFNTFGLTVIQKKISIPLSGVTVNNPNGTITYTPIGGNWPSSTTVLDTIFQGDNNNQVSAQTSDNFVNVPFNISGFTNSKLNELKRYGSTKFSIGYQFFKNNNFYGQIDSISPDYTAYTINNINYIDLPNGKTFYVVSTSGITNDMIVSSAITKNEYLLDFVMDPEIQSDVFIERGKYSVFESLQRLGEVDNTGDLTTYGYGYFKINKT
jgi:hypothetical protein